MLNAEKQTRLTGFLGQLPPSVAARLAKAIEVDRMIGGTNLPHAEILAVLHPRLTMGISPGPTRPSAPNETPERRFCSIFEDIVAAEDGNIKRQGRISRASIEPLLAWLRSELMPELYRKSADAIAAAFARDNSDEADAVLPEFWQKASSALGAALIEDTDKARRALGSEMALEDAREIALLLSKADVIHELQARLPKPVSSLSNDDIHFVRSLFERLTAADPEFAPYIPLIAMGRLAKPWEVLRILAAISRKHDDIVLSETDLGLAGEILFEDLDTYAKRIQSVRPLDFDARALLADLAAFSELSGGVVREIDIRRDGRWGHKLGKDRASVSAVMETLIERAPREVFAGLPAVKPGIFTKGPKPLDVGRAPDPERANRSLRFAQLLAYARPLAEAAAFKAKLDEVFDETANALRSYNEDILREFRAAPADIRETAEQHFANTLEITKLILGEADAGYLLRRSRLRAQN